MRRESLTAIKLTDLENKKIMDEIQALFMDIMDEEVGIIKQQQALDFIMDKIAPYIYNKALDEVKAWYKKQMENVDFDYDLIYKDVR